MQRILLLGCIYLCLCWSTICAQGYSVFRRHDPSLDPNLNPFTNSSINPDSNSAINPLYNWNLNPLHNTTLNPHSNASINPMNNLTLNPQSNEILNPVFMKSLMPSNPTWVGLYLFDKSNEKFGYISVASQNVMVSFDNNGQWVGYFVRAGNSTYNFYSIPGIWTEMFLCSDHANGYNLFDKTAKWTGMHIK